MKNKTFLILGGLVVAGLGYFLYSKKKSTSSSVLNIGTNGNTAPLTTNPIVNVELSKPAPVIVPIKKYVDYKYMGYSGCNIQWTQRDGSTGTRFVPSGQTSFIYEALENSGSGCGSWSKL